MTTADSTTGDRGDGLVVVGEIVAPHGLRGEVRMNPLMDEPEALVKLPAVSLRFRDGREERRRITAARRNNRQILLTIAGVGNRDAAEALRGAEVRIYRDQLPERDVYYADELVGLHVFTESGADLGRIERVLLYPANDIYETPIAMIPGIKDEFVVSVDVAEGRMVVRDVPGLRKDE